jgi:hypothetical protein
MLMLSAIWYLHPLILLNSLPARQSSGFWQTCSRCCFQAARILAANESEGTLLPPRWRPVVVVGMDGGWWMVVVVGDGRCWWMVVGGDGVMVMAGVADARRTRQKKCS